MLGLYLHIPFCQAICSYCNFNRGLLDPELKTRYVAALEREILESAAPGTPQPADTIFFGGGTPSLLDPSEISRLIAACRSAYAVSPDAEITLETNPETATPARLDAFREAGINRISFGVQSFDDAQLARLGRIHSAARAKDTIRDARAAGILVRDLQAIGGDIAKVIDEAMERLDRAGLEAIMIDFDIDVIDRSQCPGAPGARPGGLHVNQFFAAARHALSFPKVRLVDLTEFDPSLDVSDITALTAGRWVCEVLAGYSRR
jgi:MoaA/NifB/PqqE/SkfB family radical SAM enzyme